jgi:trans-aconitate methyltransferase
MIGFYDRIYTDNPHKWSGEARDEFAFQALSSYSDPASLLDFGCGNGHTLRYFMNKWPETEYYGVDISGVALEIARRKVPTAKFFSTISMRKDYTDDAIPKVNIITMLGVLEHLQNLSDIPKIAEHLSPGGIMYVEVPNCLSYSNSKDEGFRKTTGGTGQVEWHLKRETWEVVFVGEGLEIVKSLTGLQPAWQFVWLLKCA